MFKIRSKNEHVKSKKKKKYLHLSDTTNRTKTITSC